MTNVTVSGTTIECRVEHTDINISVASGTELKVILDNLIAIPQHQDANVRIFEFSQPQSTWTVAHNTGRKVFIVPYSTGWIEVDGEIVHISDNVAQVRFSTQISGYVLVF